MVDRPNSCLHCVHCLPCAMYLDDGKPLTNKKIDEICKVMGGFRKQED